MLNAAAALAFLVSLAFPADAADPIAYESVLAEAATGTGADEANEAANGSAAPAVSAEQAALMARQPDWANMRWTMYHAGGGGATGNDSLGCRPVAMRTVAVDPRVIPRRTRLFIRETVGMRLPDGGRHDGYWYATDTGGAIKGAKIDLYTGHGSASMRPVRALNLGRLSVVNAGRFEGCPPVS